VSIEECMGIEKCSMSDYIKRTCDGGETTLNASLRNKTAVELKNNKAIERTDRWNEKALHG